ncbi:MAG: succinylglutamate desuccinylase/aspartoacylase family protein [Nevskia sp.]|nr:succinylglutamate desuccinylase/aspartoacylase family protein [Nevskia sp.]
MPVSAQLQVSALCSQFAGRIGGFSSDECRLAGLHPTAAASSLGRPLLVRDVPAAVPGIKAPRKVLVLGGIHGDEYSAVVVAFQWIERLNGDRFQRFQWRFLPCVNPDGLLAQPSTRTNAHGVDLNRNFPTPDWSHDAMAYWKSKAGKDPRRFPGKQAASEPETHWIVEQIASYKPDAIVSIHAPLNLLDFDGPYTPPARLGYLHLAPIGTYPGSLGGYAGLFLRLPVMTPELPTAKHTPSAEQSGRILADLIDWLNKNLPAA